MSDQTRLTSIPDTSGDYGRKPDYSGATGPAACARLVQGKSDSGQSVAVTPPREKVVPNPALSE